MQAMRLSIIRVSIRQDDAFTSTAESAEPKARERRYQGDWPTRIGCRDRSRVVLV
jgi:hypothetical protein